MKAAQAGMGAIVLLLVVTGVAGTIYKIVAPDGWVIGAFQRSPTAGLALIGTLGLVGLFTWLWHGSALRRRNTHASLFVYAFATAGFLYVARYWMHGTL